MSGNIDAELAWDDLRDRLRRAEAALVRMGETQHDQRNLAKATGVRLALSYMDDYRVEVGS